jgi:type IV pilus assembly protein PilY1
MKTNNTKCRSFFAKALVVLGTFLSGAAGAQDIELFSGNNPAATAIPNVLIILDNTSNWNGTLQNGQSAWDPELVALANAIQGLADQGFGEKIRIGMMMFTGSGVNGGYVRYTIRQMNSTNAPQLKNVALTIRSEQLANGNPEGGNNPTYGQSMNEAYLYYFGKTPRAGFDDVRRDCGSGNSNNLVLTPSPGYTLLTLSPFAYTGCGSGDPTKKNSFTGANNNASVAYKAPDDVTLACQRNFIIFISNGPISNNDNGPGLDLLRAAISAEGASSTYSQVIPVTPSGETGSNYADEWAKFLNEVKNVTTYTINVQTSTGQSANHDAMMRSMATNGGGDVCNATDPAAIQACINATFNKILAVNSVFAAVSLPVSSYPQVQNLDQVYLGMFRPDDNGNPRWFGNLKQYKLSLDSNGNGTLVDSANATAIDPSNGQPFPTDVSYWTASSNYWSYSPRGFPKTASDSPDGALVEKGGAAQRLRTVYAADATTGASNIVNRKVFTCVGCTSQTALVGGTDSSTGVTSFSSANASTLATGLRVTSAAAPSLIKWIRGENTDGEKTDAGVGDVRPSIHGDVLHSRPAILTLSPTDVYLFYGSNDGMIHAVRGGRDTDGGNELWSFLPEEFLPRLNRLRTNEPVTWVFDTISTTVALTSGSTTATVGSTTGLLQGMYLEGTTGVPLYTYITAIDTATNAITLSQPATSGQSFTGRFVPEAKPAFADGSMTIYADPTNSKTYLFAAVRRGGRFIYAFDITDPRNPIYLWRKGCNHAGITSNNGYGCDSGYDELGQTWSELRVARIGTQSDNQTVLIFGAGYDPTADDPDPALGTGSRTMGRGVFVVDAHTGAIVNEIRPTKMDYAVPSDITLIDFDGDGFLDRLYFGDTGGQVWRIDTTLNKDTTTWPVSRIASLGIGDDSGLSGSANGRKFLFAPDVVETAPFSGVYSIVLTSGDRENPLNGSDRKASVATVVNRLYMLLDGSDRGSTVIKESDLEDRTTNSFTAKNPNLGWYITLAKPGEKGTGGIVTLSGTSYIGTNYPVSAGSQECFSNVGNARFYQINFLTGAGMGTGADSSGADITAGRFTEIRAGGLPPSPVGTIIQVGDNKYLESVLLGTKSLPVGPAKVGDRFRNYWYKLFDKK